MQLRRDVALRETLDRARLGRRDLLAALAAAGAGALGGCAALPSAGEVHQVRLDDGHADPLVQTADLPLVGAEPTEIVSGFLRACAAGVNESFATARQYLTGPVASGWRPEATVRIYPLPDSPTITKDETGAVKVMATVLSTVDANGVYTPSGEDKQVEMSFSLTRDAQGQWRIADLEDGVLLPASSFFPAFVCVPLFFLTSDGGHWVAEARWVHSRSAARGVVTRLLGGPSPWLSGVASALVPSGMTLDDPSSLTAVDGVVTVNLSSATPQPAGLLAQLSAQLHTSLSVLDTVSQVRVAVNGAWVAPAAGLPNPLSDPGRPLLVSEGAVVRGVGADREILTDLVTLGGSQVRHPVAGPDTSVYALDRGSLLRFVLGSDAASVVYSAPDQEATQDGLLPPVVDADGWVWTGAKGQLVVVNARGTSYEIKADWLDGTVSAFDLSAECGRVALVVVGPQETRVAVCHVLREGGDAHPSALGQPQWVKSTSAKQVAWTGPATLAVLMESEDGGEVVRLKTVGGSYEDAPAVKGTVSLAGGRTDGDLLACDSHSVLWRRSGSTWLEVSSGCLDPSFPMPGLG